MKNRIFFAFMTCFQLTILGFTTPPQTSQNNSESDSSNLNTLLVEDFFLAYENNDIPFINKIMAKNYSISNAADIHEMTYSKYSEMSKNIKVRIGAMHKALPEFSLQVKEIIANGNKVFAKTVISGIQKGEFLGSAPTNKPIHIHIYSVFTLEDGKIHSISEMWNELSIMKQLGCVVL